LPKEIANAPCQNGLVGGGEKESGIKKPAPVVAQDAGSLLVRRSIRSNTQLVVTTICAASVIGGFADFIGYIRKD